MTLGRYGLTLWGSVLDGDVDDLAVLGDDGTSLESGTAKEGLGVKDESGSGTKGALVVSDYTL